MIKLDTFLSSLQRPLVKPEEPEISCCPQDLKMILLETFSSSLLRPLVKLEEPEMSCCLLDRMVVCGQSALMDISSSMLHMSLMYYYFRRRRHR